MIHKHLMWTIISLNRLSNRLHIKFHVLYREGTTIPTTTFVIHTTTFWKVVRIDQLPFTLPHPFPFSLPHSSHPTLSLSSSFLTLVSPTPHSLPFPTIFSSSLWVCPTLQLLSPFISHFHLSRLVKIYFFCFIYTKKNAISLCYGLRNTTKLYFHFYFIFL